MSMRGCGVLLCLVGLLWLSAATLQAGQAGAGGLGYHDQALETLWQAQLKDAAGRTAPGDFSQALSSAHKALAQKSWAALITAANTALALDRHAVEAWLLLAQGHLYITPEYEWQQADHRFHAAVAAYGAYRSSTQTAEQVRALSLLAEAQRQRSHFHEAELVLRQILALDAQASAAKAALEQLLKAHPFGVQEMTAEAERDHPQLCLRFNRGLQNMQALNYKDYLRIAPELDYVVRTEEMTLCLEGVRHGVEYAVTVLPGLTSAAGSATVSSTTQRMMVPDREPAIFFRGQRYVLPKVGSQGVPIVTVNTDAVQLSLWRVTDRNLVEEINRDRLGQSLYYWMLEDFKAERAEKVWEGALDTPGESNRETTTAFPIGQLLSRPEPGIYLLAAELHEDDARYYEPITQWVLVSDTGLISYWGQDGLTVVANSLATGKALADVRLTLLSRSNRVLGTATTDANGVARLSAGLLRGTLGAEPVALTALSKDGDFALLELTQPAFDLADRGVSGRPSPGAVDAFMYTERGIYRPGETVHASVLLRDANAKALSELPATLRVLRPDGVESRRLSLAANPSGAHALSLPMDERAPTGLWRLHLHLDPEAEPVGQTAFQVEDFVPPLVEFNVSAEAPQLIPGQPLAVEIAARFLYGAVAAGLRGEAELVIEAQQGPLEGYPGYHFGRADESWTPFRHSLTVPATDAQGQSRLALLLNTLPESSRPLEARLRVTLFEEGGRPVNRSLRMAVAPQRPMIGVRPLWGEGEIGLNQAAEFAIMARSVHGEQLSQYPLEWVLYEEVRDYFWYRDHEHWTYRTVSTDRYLSSGKMQTGTAEQPGTLRLQQDWGHYRLEIKDPHSGAVSSFAFSVGYGSTGQATQTPDKMQVTLDKAQYLPGEKAKVRLVPPFAGEVVLAVLNDGVRGVYRAQVPAEGAEFLLPVGDWQAGAYITATALRPAQAGASRGPARAVGLAWLAMDRSPRTLDVTLTAPEQITPRQSVVIPVQVKGHSGPASMTLAAVDDAVLQITAYRAPDPAAHYYGKRQLGVEIRDLYGRLLDGWLGNPGSIRTGGDISAENLAALGKRSSRVVSLFSGVVALDAKGYGEVTLDIPDFNGRLRLMAVAFNAEAVGSAQTTVLVRDPLIAEPSLPRFLAPGDAADVRLSLTALDAPAGTYTVSLAGDGEVIAAQSSLSLSLMAEQRAWLDVRIQARQLGEGQLRLQMQGPEGMSMAREWDLSVRPAHAFITRTRSGYLQPGEALRIDPELLSDVHPDQARASILLASAPTVDVASLLKQLQQYPYGCLEQVTSRALPLLYWHTEQPPATHRGIQQALARIEAMQNADGGFGLWSATGPADLWLSAYALDFLQQAQQVGVSINEASYRRGLAFLGRAVASGDFEPTQLPAVSYAHYVLAHSGTSKTAELRHFADTYLQTLPTRIAKAQIGAALTQAGDAARADTAFKAAQDHQETAADAWRYRTYGSELRDRAALLALAARSQRSVDELFALATQLQERYQPNMAVSTQEMAWLLVAAHHLKSRSAAFEFTLDGQRQQVTQGIWLSALPVDRLRQGITLSQNGTQALYYALSTAGFPLNDSGPSSHGLQLSRQFYTREGTPLTLEQLSQNEVVVAVLEGQMQKPYLPARRLLLVDLLTAGFELENAALGGANLRDLAWLGETLTGLIDPEATQSTGVVHVDLRDDRFIAQLDLSQEDNQFKVAYLMRAVTPGEYALPPSFVEDMYAPSAHARTAGARVKILPAP